jgi:hypothetical protein
MPFLKELRLDSNKFTGPMTSLGALTSLVTVRLQENYNLTGSLPQLSSLGALESFYCIQCSLTGALPALSSNTQLKDFRCDSQFSIAEFTGSIPNLSYNTLLRYFYGFNNKFSGNIPDLSNNSLLREFRVRNNLLTGWTGGTVSNQLEYFDASNNLLPTSAINAILAAFVAANRFTGSLILSGGDNSPPSGQGLVDAVTLSASRGWTVVTSDTCSDEIARVTMSGDFGAPVTLVQRPDIDTPYYQNGTYVVSSDTGIWSFRNGATMLTAEDSVEEWPWLVSWPVPYTATKTCP